MFDLLTGLTVVEASRGVAVRYCGRLFAQLGATVVKAAGGDDTAIGYAGAAGEAYGAWLDAGKVAARPDGGVDLVIAGMDVEGVAAGEALAAGLPGSPVTLGITWFHPEGPYAAWAGSDEIMHALAGLAYSFGPIEGPPMLAQGHAPQVCAGLAGFNAALGTLMGAERPKRIAMNVLEAYLCLTESGAVSALLAGGESVRLGVNRFVPTYPSASYRTKDGWLGLTALTPAQWRGLCEMIGQPELAREVKFTTSLERLMFAEEIDAAIVPAFPAKTTAEWVALGFEKRVPVTAMPDLRELPNVPHWQARGAFAAYDGSGRVAPTLPFAIEPFGSRSWRVGRGGPKGKPLAGLKVVDFTMGWAGPLCTRTLADLGAEVVKIESETHPDWWRGWEMEAGDPPPHEVKFSFIGVNRNKRGVALDLTTPAGLAAARQLIARSDVLVENFAAGIMDQLGLGRDVRRALNPRLVAVSMPAFGNGGPLSSTRAYGSTVEQASGLPHVNGHADWPPCLQHVAFGDPIAGLFAACATLSTLAAGPALGAEIDLAQVACLMQMGADAFIAQSFVEGPLPRTGARRPRAAPVCVVAADGVEGWLAVAVQGDAQWSALAGVLGLPAALTLAERQARADQIEAAIAAWAAGQDPMSAAETLQAAGVSAAPVQPIHALCYDAQLSATGFWAELHRDYVGAHLVPASPWLCDGERPELYRAAPTLGQHTAEVLAELAVAKA